MQLVAYGAQDTAITGKPQITFFRSVYRRHTNFAIESIAQTFIGTAGFGKKITTSLSRNGDLVNACVLEVRLPSIKNTAGGTKTLRWIDNLGHYLIKRVELDIGGQRVDWHTGEWLHIWDELTRSSSKDGDTTNWGSGFNRMNGNVSKLTTGVANDETIDATTVYIPLKFWFNDPKSPGLSLPLLALQYHEVRISIEFNDICSLLVKDDTGSPGPGPVTPSGGSCSACNCSSEDFEILDGDCFDAQLYVDYIYLDNEERRRFAQDNHEYLIPQVQFTGSECIGGGAKCGTKRYRMNFNHPVKELVWVVHNSAEPQPSVYSTKKGRNPVCRAKMMLNGHDRFSERRGEYFDCVQPYMHHSRCPSRGINVYSFAFKPEQHQPSGTCNFSRIDNAQLEVVIRDDATTEGSDEQLSLRVYAVNYNLLRVMSGLAGVAYSN
jgi:hypothetical protein